MGPLLPHFHLFLSFMNTVQKNSAANRIQTRIVEVEGKDTDHFTTTTAMVQKTSIQVSCDTFLPIHTETHSKERTSRMIANV